MILTKRLSFNADFLFSYLPEVQIPSEIHIRKVHSVWHSQRKQNLLQYLNILRKATCIKYQHINSMFVSIEVYKNESSVDMATVVKGNPNLMRGRAQEELTSPVMMSLGVLRFWALVLVTAPCFCRRWSLSWLLCLKWRSHFSHWGKGGKVVNHFSNEPLPAPQPPQLFFLSLSRITV